MLVDGRLEGKVTRGREGCCVPYGTDLFIVYIPLYILCLYVPLCIYLFIVYIVYILYALLFRS